jgi:hypothetical protein
MTDAELKVEIAEQMPELAEILGVRGANRRAGVAFLRFTAH